MEPQEPNSTGQVEPEDGAPAQSAGTGAGLEVALLLVVVAVGVSFFVRRFARAARAGRTVRQSVPLLYAGIWGLTFLALAPIVAHRIADIGSLAIWLVVLLLAFASIGWIRSVLAGIALAVEGRVRIGDSIRVGADEGEVVAFGMRATRLRATDGTMHEIPHEQLMSSSLANLSGERGDSACEVSFRLPRGTDPEQARLKAQRQSVLSPLASPRHRPEVFVEQDPSDSRRFSLRIRGYPFDPAFQEHFRSDVAARLASTFAEESPAPVASALLAAD